MWHWFLKGGPVMWPLLLCSVIALGVIMERLIFWVRERRTQNIELVHQLLHFTERGLFDEVTAAAQGTRDAVARILVNGLSHHHFSLEGALEVAVHAELKRMKRYLGVLDTIITVAPLLGIFGTVTGILVAFGALEGRIPDPKIVASGIAQAVITTVVGLAIAIPTIVAYNYFCAKVEDATSQISTHVTNFQILYQKGKAKHADQGVSV
ncbi:MAG: MotA/TolQ/ExbB proton channel family protein [Candidatus Omnitrophica bacterium]|nr:MotA/TolQ/ExbB proton channel family protein [Candidatus Omnitrophota bacterium]